jgi:hypothetical protein
MWNLMRSRPQANEGNGRDERKRAILTRMNLAELADIGLKPSDIALLTGRS